MRKEYFFFKVVGCACRKERLGEQNVLDAEFENEVKEQKPARIAGTQLEETR